MRGSFVVPPQDDTLVVQDDTVGVLVMLTPMAIVGKHLFIQWQCVMGEILYFVQDDTLVVGKHQFDKAKQSIT
jgi:hypothetical protein